MRPTLGPLFRAGVGAFAVGHLAYITLFLLQPLADIARIVQFPQVWLAGALVVFGMIMARVLFPRAGALRGPVLAYIPIILGMGVAVLALPPPVWALLAAVAFITSDLVLASEKFLLPDGHPALRTIAASAAAFPYAPRAAVSLGPAPYVAIDSLAARKHSSA